MDNEALFLDLFAYRINYLDFSNYESYIISKLKLKLIELGYQENELNILLFGFYNYFDIPITMSEIESVQTILMSSTLLPININNPLNNNEDDDNEDDDIPPLVENPFNIINLLNTILGGQFILPNEQFNQGLHPTLIQPLDNVLEDIVVTTDENTLNTLNILKITKDMNERCTICLSEMIEDEEYLDIKCKHIFHKDCLETYLKNYNHICPVCREEIGISHPNIN